MSAPMNQAELKSFHSHLSQSKRVLALLGAGLSASSGLPTFRGAGGLWRTHDSISLATPDAFEEDPGLPNPAHYALAELARKMPGFMTLSQNVDGLSQRANHPPEQLQLLHGTLFELKCSNEYSDYRGSNEDCDYRETNFTDPVVPALAIPTGGMDPTSDEAREEVSKQLQAQAGGNDLDISDANVPIPSLTAVDLPHCPKCKTNLLRPGVVWFGEALPRDVLDTVDDFLEARKEDGRPERIDLIMVIGTSAQVTPAASYIDFARAKGARVCVVNMDTNDAPSSGWREGDWLFQGDAAVLVPELLKPVTGDVTPKV
ncbi:hypothetical protein LTR37_016229 [Vermiconidia calcicola]|uniref:Uncharacterized protein n=1 Tax=Vermiconidia calcicola TaxID=1690605 RepID=A0ACC3MPV3_9PEZI|nr:hypothetical protein LTR37_016229 [Vermiconidia calcicola]